MCQLGLCVVNLFLRVTLPLNPFFHVNKNTRILQYKANGFKQCLIYLLGLVSLFKFWFSSFQENLFYTVPPGAIEAYRKAIDSHLQQIKVNTCKRLYYVIFVSIVKLFLLCHSLSLLFMWIEGLLKIWELWSILILSSPFLNNSWNIITCI